MAGGKEVGAELERIRKANGGISPASVVDEARDEESPLHDWFEWDDTEAAERFRYEEPEAFAAAVIRVLSETDLRDRLRALAPADASSSTSPVTSFRRTTVLRIAP